MELSTLVEVSALRGGYIVKVSEDGDECTVRVRYTAEDVAKLVIEALHAVDTEPEVREGVEKALKTKS